MKFNSYSIVAPAMKMAKGQALIEHQGLTIVKHTKLYLRMDKKLEY